jgi:MFS family permease
LSPATAPRVSRYTYQLHARAAVLEGILAGIIVTQDVVARKTLGASQWQLVLLTMAPGSSWLLSLFFANQFQQYDRRKLFFWAGFAGRLPLLTVAGMSGLWPFVAVLVLHGFVQTALIPAQNSLYQQNYDPLVRGRLFGRASLWGALATAVASLVTGFAMEYGPQIGRALGFHGGAPKWLLGPEAFRLLYPVAGIAGFGACLVYGSIRLRGSGRPSLRAPIEAAARARWTPQELMLGPFRRAFHAVRTTLVEDPGFRRFEVAIFIYGLGFMVMQPVFAVLFVDELHMNYLQASLAKGVVFFAANIAAVAYAGRTYDRIGLERLGARATILLAVFAAWLAWVNSPGEVIAAYVLFGVAMAALNIVWSMGPIHYAPAGNAARYMSIHVALVGLRAILGHPLGGAIAEGARYLGLPRPSRPAFVVAAGLFGIATVLMIRAERLSPKRKAH